MLVLRFSVVNAAGSWILTKHLVFVFFVLFV